jgi:hypothetical protein
VPDHSHLSSPLSPLSHSLTLTLLSHTHSHQISKYPTILYFPGDDKKNPVEFKGAKEVDDLLAFVNEQLAEEDADVGEDDL